MSGEKFSLMLPANTVDLLCVFLNEGKHVSIRLMTALLDKLPCLLIFTKSGKEFLRCYLVDHCLLCDANSFKCVVSLVEYVNISEKLAPGSVRYFHPSNLLIFILCPKVVPNFLVNDGREIQGFAFTVLEFLNPFLTKKLLEVIVGLNC